MPVLDTTNGGGLLASTLGITNFPFTMAAWVRRTDDHTGPGQIGSLGNDWQNYHRFQVNALNQPAMASRCNSGTERLATMSTVTTPLNDWVPVVARFTAADERSIYMGSLVSEVTTATDAGCFSSGANPVNSFRLGRFQPATQRFRGLIAHAAVWNKALTDSEVESFLDGGNPLAVAGDNLRAYWGEDFFQDGGAWYYEDLSGNGHHLALEANAVRDTTTTPPAIDPLPATGLSFTTPPSVTDRTSTSYILEGTLSEQGQVHAVAVAHGDGTPSIAQIVAGQRSNGSAAPGSGNTTTTGAGNFTLTVSGSGVAAAPSHDIHYVGRAPE